MTEKDRYSSGPAPIPEGHPLRELFHSLVADAFHRTLGLRQREISAYLADMLTEFAHTDALYRVRNAEAVRLDEVAAMLMEADVTLNATSFEQERAVHK